MRRWTMLKQRVTSRALLIGAVVSACTGSDGEIGPQQPICDPEIPIEDGYVHIEAGEIRDISMCHIGDDPCGGSPCPTKVQVLERFDYFACPVDDDLHGVRAWRCVQTGLGIEYDVIRISPCFFSEVSYTFVFDPSGRLIRRTEYYTHAQSVYPTTLCCAGQEISRMVRWGDVTLECEERYDYDPNDFLDTPADECPWR